MWKLSKVSPALFHNFLINKTNQSSLSNAYICTMSNTWVEGKKVPSVSSMHLLPNIRHLESLNEPNDWLFHASLKILGSWEGKSPWMAYELHGEADWGRNAVDSNALLRKMVGGNGYSFPSKSDKDDSLFSHLYLRSTGDWHIAGNRCWGLWGRSSLARPYLWIQKDLRTVLIHLKEIIPESVLIIVQSRCRFHTGMPIAPLQKSGWYYSTISTQTLQMPSQVRT